MYQHYVMLGIGIVSALAFVVFLFSSGTIQVDVNITEVKEEKKDKTKSKENTSGMETEKDSEK